MNRFEAERAVIASCLPGTSKVILLVLCTHINARTGEIPRRYQPSTRQLGRECGRARDTVRRHLAELERAGWLRIERPTAHQAAAEHMTCAYTLLVPVSAGHEEAGPAAGPELGRRSGQAGPAAGPELGRPSVTDREETEIVTETEIVISVADLFPANIDRLAQVVIDELRAVAPGRPISRRQAAEICRRLLIGREVRRPEAYLRRALREDPQRYLPAAGNQPGPSHEDPAITTRSRKLRERYRYDTADDI